MFTAPFLATFIFSEGLYSQSASAQHHKVNINWTMKKGPSNDYKTSNRGLIFEEGPKNVVLMSIVCQLHPSSARLGLKTAVFDGVEYLTDFR